MRTRVAFVLVALALTACGKEDRHAPKETAAAASSPSPTASGWSEFHGIQYQAPPGTNARITESVLPGPGGQGGIANGERPTVTLTMAGTEPGTTRFYVEIAKPAQPISLEGMKYALAASKENTNLAGKSSGESWELTWEWRRGAAEAGRGHVVYAVIAGGNFQCTYDEANCKDIAAAEAICRSMRAKPGK